VIAPLSKVQIKFDIFLVLFNNISFSRNTPLYIELCINHLVKTDRDNVLILQLSKNRVKYKYIFTESYLQKHIHALITACKLLTPRPQNSQLFCVLKTGHLTNDKIPFFDLYKL